MDLTPKMMYDTFKDDIWKELGPLDPDWFDVLTARTFADEGSVSDQDDLCANQEGNFKTPFDKTAADSELFSTPRVFRQGGVVSPETEDDQLFTKEQEKETLPWTATQNPHLFRTPKERVLCAKYGGTEPQSQDSFDLLHTPQKSPLSCAKHISESLGAQIHPDISWTSSLNTPPAVPSTLILSKTDASPCQVSVSADKSFVLVRKLFPSLSNASRVGAVSPQNTEIPVLHKGALSPEAGQKPHDSPQSSLNQCEGVWKHKLLDATEDGEICNTVGGVLEGAENVPSMFFTNSSSALRKVKTDSNKRKLIIPTGEHDYNSTDISTTNNAASSQQRTDEREPGKCSPFPQKRSGLTGITQWSPLSLSEIPPSPVYTSSQDNNPATQMENNVLTDKLQSDTDSGQPVKTPLIVTDSGFTKKRRNFIYTIDASKTEIQGKEIQSQKRESSQGISVFGHEVSVTKLEKAQDEANCCSTGENKMQKQENVTDKNVPASVEAKDLDMSHLCREFTEDFSQMSDHGKLSEIAEDTSQSGFSPSACLSAMKRAKQKARQANSHQDGDRVSNRRHVSATNQNFSINEGTISDSGFQSTVVAITDVTTTSLTVISSENNSQSESRFKSDTHKTASVLSTDEGSQNTHLDDILQETDVILYSAIQENQTLDPGREWELHKESTSTHFTSSIKGTVDDINCGQIKGDLPEKTTVFLPSIHTSGFKTASNNRIHISSANLKRAKCLFKEGETSFTHQLNRSAQDTKEEISVSHGSIKSKICNSNQQFVGVGCQLTASQKADVTELCTLLEEADSQFEFTQFKTSKVKQHCQDDANPLQRADKELDPDFLMGIDFDDSFSSDADKYPEKTDKMSSVSDGITNCETSKVTCKSTGASFSSALKKENSSTEDLSSSKHISEGCSGIASSEPKNLDQTGYSEIDKQENKNHLMPCVTFQTAGGNLLRVSEKHLSKARALFADLEENMTNLKSPDKQSSENTAETEQAQITSNKDEDVTKSLENNKMDTTTCQTGFQMASGKGINVSAKAMQEADAFFKDCSVMEDNADMSVKHKKSIEPLHGSVNHKKTLLYFKTVGGITDNFSEEPVRESETCNAGPAAHHSNVVQRNVEIHSLGFKNTLALTNAVSFHSNPSVTVKALPSPSCTASKNVGSSASNELSNDDGFCKAIGKKVSVSAGALKKAEVLLNEIHTLEDTNKQLQQKGDALRTGHVNKQSQVAPPKNGGFQTASGKGVVISSAALKKAKSLLSECETAENNISVKPTHSKIPVPGPLQRNSGFLAASGKPVALSAEALQKANALFSDVTCSAEIPAVSRMRNSDKNQDNVGKADVIHCGFMTAGGATVHVSQKNLLKAKNLLKEFDDDSVSAKASQNTDVFKDSDILDSNNGMLVKYDASLALGSESGSEKTTLSNRIPDQRMAMNTSVYPVSGCAELENMNLGLVVNHENVPLLDVEINKDAFKNTPHSTNAASLHGNPSLMAKLLSSPLSTTSKHTGSSGFNKFDNGGGFCTASGKKVSVSADAMTKAKALLNEGASLEYTNKQLKHNEGALPLQSRGCETASGKGVAISSAAWKKAKALLSECDGVDDKIGLKLTHSKMSVPVSLPENGGYSYKPVAFSSEALQRAEALCTETDAIAEIPTVSETRKSDRCKGAQNSKKEIHCGFTTAGGGTVHVSQRSILQAKNLLKEFADVDCRHSNSYSTRPHNTESSDLAKVKDVKTTSTLAIDKDMSATESVPHVVNFFPSLLETDHENEPLQNSNVGVCNSIQHKPPTNALKCKDDKITHSAMESCHDSPGEEMGSGLGCKVNQTSSKVEHNIKMTQESSVLVFQPHNLSGCTETQQKLLAQEALDCTKALLEDEGLTDQSLSVNLENVLLQDDPKYSNRFVEEQKGRVKRAVEDADMTGQPPLKRRLLEEFNMAVGGSRDSTLRPEKSCPKGLMNDRRVFKYSDFLHPNITKPHRNGKNYVESRLQRTPTQHSTPGDTSSAHSKMPVFVPPFHKNTKTEPCKITVLKDDIKTPAFIPPFKKQRTIVQESSCKVQEDQHHHPFVTLSNSNRDVLPTNKTQTTTDVTDNKSKGDTQTVDLADTINDNLINNQNHPVGCGSEDYSAEAPCVGDTLSTSEDMSPNLESVQLARDMQDMRIRKKKRQTIRPLPGSLFLTKMSGVLRISLKDAVNGKLPARHTQKQLYGYGVQWHVSEITSETAETFRFSLLQFFQKEAFIDCGGVQLADGGWLITSNDGTAGKEEFYRALCDTPGVDPKLISQEWVYNHYRWIVWKQASMERSFPETMGSLCLTPEQVLLQLKYRYDVEVDHSRRPALRKIMERDDTAAKTLVLCVCGVVSRGHSPYKRSSNDTKTPQDVKVENPCAVVWLTDGWYAIKAQLDEPLTAMLHKGGLAVGGKLIIHGAQLVGSQDACSPLEAPESLMLKICANSSRPARWDTKLGFCKNPRPFLLPVSSLYSNGGPVGCVDIIVLRSYPIQWMERKPNAGVVFRSVRAEEKEARSYNSHKQKAMEILFAKIEAEFEKEEKCNNKTQHKRRTRSRQDIASLQDGEELYEAVGDDPTYLEAYLSGQQLETLHTYRRSLMEKKQAELQDRYRRALEAEDVEGSCPKRDVTPVWRLSIADSMDQSGSVYQLNLWRPSSDLQSVLKEGCRYKVFNLTTSDGKKRSGIQTIQLTGTKKTQFQDLQVSQEWLSTRFQLRVSASFMDLQNPDFQPLCGEVDLTGYVISVIDGQGSSPAFYLADGRLNFVKVRCFSSLSQSGLEDVIKPCILLALSNLQLRGQSISPTAVVYAGDLTIFSTNPKEVHLQESLSQLRNLVQGHENFHLTAEKKLSHLVKSDGLSSISSPALQPLTPTSTMDRRQDTKTTQPVRSLGSFTPVSRNPPAATSSTEKDPKSLKRKRALDYLSRIPSPPILSHLGSVASPTVNKTFNPPRRSRMPSTLKTVQTPACKPVNSPVEDEWVNDEELAMIDTQALRAGNVDI